MDGPKLRGIEAFPLEQDGQRFIALRDPAGCTESVLLLPKALVDVVALFDGEHTIVDIQAELTRRYDGEIVPRADIEKIIAMLDEHGFLESDRFAARQASVDGAFLSAPTRPASHAGGAYPGTADELRATMDDFFTHKEGPGAIAWTAKPGSPAVEGIIAPHIDFHRGGPAYAWAYRDLAERCAADLFVIVGTCHAGMDHPFALTRKDYDTPFGPARIDQDFVEDLTKRAKQDCFGSELAHRNEHSLEFQAVFLQYLYAGRRDVTVVPVLASFAHEVIASRRRPSDDSRVARFLNALVETIAASHRRVALIAGADLAHMGPRFGDPRPISKAGRAQIEAEDRRMLQSVEAGDAEAFFDSVAADGDRRRICGLSPIYAVLHALGHRHGALKRYGLWPDPQGIVSYASVVFDGSAS